MSIKTRLLSVGLPMVLATAGALIYPFEGEERKAYVDIVGVPTACIGSTAGVVLGRTYTEKECTERFAKDLLEASTAVERCTPNLPPGPKAALISLTFNIGTHAYCSSTLAKLANKQDYPGACAQLYRWVYAGGKRVQGLHNRRHVEYLYCTGVKQI